MLPIEAAEAPPLPNSGPPTVPERPPTLPERGPNLPERMSAIAERSRGTSQEKSVMGLVNSYQQRMGGQGRDANRNSAPWLDRGNNNDQHVETTFYSTSEVGQSTSCPTSSLECPDDQLQSTMTWLMRLNLANQHFLIILWSGELLTDWLSVNKIVINCHCLSHLIVSRLACWLRCSLLTASI